MTTGLQLKLACGALAAAALYPGCAEKNEIPEITPQMALDHGLRPTDLARGRGISMAHQLWWYVHCMDNSLKIGLHA